MVKINSRKNSFLSSFSSTSSTSSTVTEVVQLNHSNITVKDINAQVFVKAYAAYLKRSGKISVPKCVDAMVKTGNSTTTPFDKDWYYIRTASVARHFYFRSKVVVGSLYKVNNNNLGIPSRGVMIRPPHLVNSCSGLSSIGNHHVNSSGQMIRKIIQSLEAMDIIEKDNNGDKRISQKGRKSLDLFAAQIYEQTGEEALNSKHFKILSY